MEILILAFIILLLNINIDLCDYGIPNDISQREFNLFPNKNDRLNREDRDLQIELDSRANLFLSIDRLAIENARSFADSVGLDYNYDVRMMYENRNPHDLLNK